MKRLFILLLVSLFVLASRSSVFAQTNMCNQSCDVDSDCGRGYRCYVGVCRLDACPAVSSCVCNSAQVTPAPTATPLVARTPTPKPSATPTPTPRPSVVPTATVSAVPMTTPKTGFNAWAIAGISILMFFAGSTLMAKEKMADIGSLSPQELVNKRRSSRA